MPLAADEAPASPAQPARQPMFGAMTPAVTVLALFVAAVVSWWLLGDPQWNVVGMRSNDPAVVTTNLAIVGCFLFWIIFAHIFTGFTFANWPFNRLSQPLAGIVHVVCDVIIGVCGALLFTRIVGSWDPTFSADAPAGAGYTGAAFIVLIGFYAYAFVAAALAGYPFEETPSPTASLAQWLFGAFLTTVGTVALIYPNFNAQLAPHAPISLPTVTGWIYSSILIVIFGAQVWGGWPWGLVANRHWSALVALVATLGGGYLLMLLFEQVLKLILPGDVLNSKGFPLALETAQLGVCFALCALTNGLVVPPGESSSIFASRIVRTILVTVCAIVIYVVFMRVFATTVLHFPAVKGSYGGNPLLWIDWLILLLLWHAVAFEGFLSTRASRQ